MLLSFRCKKVFEKLAALVFQNTPIYGGFGVGETGLSGIHPHAVPAFGVGRAEHDSADTGPEGSSCAHGAGLEGNVQRALVEVLASEVFGRCSERLHFRVRSEIVEPFAEVVSASNHLSSGHDHSADRHFVLFECVLGFGQRQAHEMFVVERLFHLPKLRGCNQFVERLCRTTIGFKARHRAGGLGQDA